MNKKQLLYDRKVQIANRNIDINRIKKEIQKLENRLQQLDENYLFKNNKDIQIKQEIKEKTVLISRLQKLNMI